VTTPVPHSERRSQPTGVAPTLSVIVPVYNSTAYLRQCLAALAASDYHDFDVWVVDDGSTEPIAPLVATYGFRYLRLEGPGGPARARNHGAAQVPGHYLVFIDADVCVHTDTLKRFAAAFTADPTLDAVVGSYDDTPAASNFLSQYKNLFHHYVHQRHNGTIHSFWSGCGAIRRDLFLAWGGFDARRYQRPAIEDIELGAALSAAGYRITLDRYVVVTHLKRWTLLSLLKADIFDRGIPWVSLMWRMGAMARTLNVTPTQRLSVLLVYGLGLALLGASRWSPAWFGVAGCTLAVLLINQDFYRYMARHRGLWFALRVLPLHWLYFLYCGVCVVWGTCRHYLSGDARLKREGSSA